MGNFFLRLDMTSPLDLVRPKVIESGRLYRSNLIEDVPLVLSLTHFFSGEQKLRLQGGVKDLYANSVPSQYTCGDRQCA